MPDTLTAAPTRADILAAFRAFICQRPGLDPRNYASDWRDREGIAAYRADARDITADRTAALDLLAAVTRAEGITPDAMLTELHHRLTWDAERGTLDYCTGQYFCTEYRRAACAALSAMLWSYWRDFGGCDTADQIRAEARRTFRSRRVRRFFN